MTGFCGWSGPSGSPEPASVLLRTMAAGLLPPGAGVGTDDIAAGAAAEAAALHIRGPARAAGHAADGGLQAAMLGHPRWSNPALAETAKQRGHVAALIEAYRRYDVRLFDHLAGPAAVAVVDAERHRALVANDRMGIHPVFYAPNAGALVFGTSAQSVRAHPRVSDSLSLQTLAEFISFGACLAPRSIYADQARLLPGQFVLWENGVAVRDFYWRMPYRTDATGDVPALVEELHRLLRQAVSRCIEGEDPAGLGAFLSGGLDSSTVAGVLSEIAPGRANSFTIGFELPQFDESEFARIAAERFATRHHRHVLTPDEAMHRLPGLTAAYDEPFGNSSAIPVLSCADLAARSGISCLLAGDGGDELFAGNARYVEQKRLQLYHHLPGPLRRRLIEPVLSGMPGSGGWGLWRKARAYVRYSNLPLPQRYYGPSFTSALPAAALFEPDIVRSISPEATSALLEDVWNRTATPDLVQRMMHMDLKETLADNDLRKVTVMCRLAGVPVRFPMLDDDVVAFSARVPPRVLLRRLRLRDFYKQAMRGWLPDRIIDKRKHGFGMPYDHWMSSQAWTRSLAADALDGMRGRGLLRDTVLDDIDPRNADGSRPRQPGLLWDVVVLELWLRAHQAPVRLIAAA